jgi:transposase
VLACAATFAGRPPTIRSLQARATGRVTQATARFWVDRWRRLLPPPDDAELRAQRLGRDLARHQRLQADITAVAAQLGQLLAATPGQILTSLPGVAAVRAAAFAAHSLPITRFPTPEHLDAATGLAPATWQSASLKRRGRISRQGLPEHRDALRASPGACPNTRPASASETPSCAAAACGPSRPGWPWPATPAGSVTPC